MCCALPACSANRHPSSSQASIASPIGSSSIDVAAKISPTGTKKTPPVKRSRQRACLPMAIAREVLPDLGHPSRPMHSADRLLTSSGSSAPMIRVRPSRLFASSDSSISVVALYGSLGLSLMCYNGEGTNHGIRSRFAEETLACPDDSLLPAPDEGPGPERSWMNATAGSRRATGSQNTMSPIGSPVSGSNASVGDRAVRVMSLPLMGDELETAMFVSVTRCDCLPPAAPDGRLLCDCTVAPVCRGYASPIGY